MGLLNLVWVLLGICAALVSCEMYTDMQKINFYVGKVGPVANKAETYRFYSLLLCAPEEIESAPTSIGEVLTGERKFEAPFSIQFKQNIENQKICEKQLN